MVPLVPMVPLNLCHVPPVYGLSVVLKALVSIVDPLSRLACTVDGNFTSIVPGSVQVIHLSGYPAGSQFGRGLEVVGDVNGDGFFDVATTAPYMGIYILFLGATMELLGYQLLEFNGGVNCVGWSLLASRGTMNGLRD